VDNHLKKQVSIKAIKNDEKNYGGVAAEAAKRTNELVFISIISISDWH